MSRVSLTREVSFGLTDESAMLPTVCAADMRCWVVAVTDHCRRSVGPMAPPAQNEWPLPFHSGPRIVWVACHAAGGWQLSDAPSVHAGRRLSQQLVLRLRLLLLNTSADNGRSRARSDDMDEHKTTLNYTHFTHSMCTSLTIFARCGGGLFCACVCSTRRLWQPIPMRCVMHRI